MKISYVLNEIIDDHTNMINNGAKRINSDNIRRQKNQKKDLIFPYRIGQYQ